MKPTSINHPQQASPSAGRDAALQPGIFDQLTLTQISQEGTMTVVPGTAGQGGQRQDVGG